MRILRASQRTKKKKKRTTEEEKCKRLGDDYQFDSYRKNNGLEYV